jgi:carbon monoxide dehydrogenase subunit G
VRVAETVEIKYGIEEVWRFVCDLTHDPAWCPKAKSVDRVGPDRWLVHHKPIPLRPTCVLTVDQVVVEAPHRLVLREEDDVSIFDVEYRLEPTSSGTRLRRSASSDGRGCPCWSNESSRQEFAVMCDGSCES